MEAAIKDARHFEEKCKQLESEKAELVEMLRRCRWLDSSHFKDAPITKLLTKMKVVESITIPDPTLPNVNLHTMGRSN